MLLSASHGFRQGWEPISLERADAGMAQLVLWLLCGPVCVSSSPPCPSQSLLQVLRNSPWRWRQMGEHTQLTKSEEPSGFPPHPFPYSLQFVSPGTFSGELSNTSHPIPAPAWKRNCWKQENHPAFFQTGKRSSKSHQQRVRNTSRAAHQSTAKGVSNTGIWECILLNMERSGNGSNSTSRKTPESPRVGKTSEITQHE